MSLNGIFDTHAHYDDSWFDEDRDELISYIRKNGVSNVINCGCDYKSSLSTLALADKCDFIYAAIGIHPETSPETIYDDFEKIKSLFNHEKIVAVGEIGLDYHYDQTPKEIQIDIFEKQLILANELNLPVIVHDREAHNDTLELLKKHRPKGVLHCYSGSVEMLKEIEKLDMYIGLGGVVTFKNAKKAVEAAAFVKADRLLLETDCPYMAPVPFRSKRCNSAMIAQTAEKIAEIRNVETQQLIDKCRNNAKELFNLK